MTPLQREELDMQIKHLDDGWKPLNRRQDKDWSVWTYLAIWVVVWATFGVLAVFAFDKIEGLMRIKWPNL